MAIRLHGSARTTLRIRAELQSAVGSNRHFAKLYGINVKTVAKWRSRDSVFDHPMDVEVITSMLSSKAMY